MKSREELRREVYQTHREYSKEEWRLACTWCGEPVDDQGWHAHEAIVKRSGVPLEQQDRIMVVENVVPVHPSCHELHGQTKQMARKAVRQLCRQLTALQVGRWYTGLIDELSLPKGLLVAPKDVPTSLALTYLALGASLHDTDIHPQNGDAVILGLAIKRWKGKRISKATKIPQALRNVTFSQIVMAVDEGAWLSYLYGIVA